MKEQPQFLRKFSKEESSEERKRVSQELREKRTENFSAKKIETERNSELKEKLEAIKRLESQINDLSQNGLSKLKNYFKLRELKGELATEKSSQQEIESKEIVPPDMEEPKRMLDNFYAEQKKKWENSPHTKEDIEKNFSEEHLSSLSMDNYILLMKRFPNEMVTHVTRQGIRDHVGHEFHTAGEGKHFDGFKKIVQDGRLKSRLGIHLTEEMKDEDIAKFLKLEDLSSKDEALEYLNRMLNHENQEDGGSYADKKAIHFAAEGVADAYYGSEKGNEIFFAYPSAHIASQYYFQGRLGEGVNDKWNDQWIWANKEKGMNVNAGITFIPEESRINKETGSRYEIDKDGNPQINIEYQQALKKIVESYDFEDFSKKAMEITGQMTSEDNWNKPEFSKKLNPFYQKLEQEFGIKDERLKHVILGYSNLRSLLRIKHGIKQTHESIEKEIEKAMKEEGILYKEASDTVSSKEYWEDYFSKNPDQRPNKMIYYKGEDPTNALYDWKRKNGLLKSTPDQDLGFGEKSIRSNSSIATAGMERFHSIAEKVIDDYYDKKTALEKSEK